jgi:hypothetical protein
MRQFRMAAAHESAVYDGASHAPSDDLWNRTAKVVNFGPIVVHRSAARGGVPMCCRLVISAAEESAYVDSAPPMGEAVDYFAYTHCGVESLRIDGHWWHAVDALYGDDGPGSAPDGWGDPYQEGELTRNSEDSITFEAQGKEVDFVPAQTNKPMRICR